MKVLYDGWPLAYRPNSPAAIHLLTLLEAHQGKDAQTAALAALPGEPFERLPDGIEIARAGTPDTDAGRLSWEQRRRPELARRFEAGLVHTMGEGLALFASTPGVLSRTDFAAGAGREALPGHRSLAGRLRDALAQGGLERAQAQLWPDDLPAPGTGPRPVRLPPAVHPLFHPPGMDWPELAGAPEELRRLDLPETYILYHGPAGEADLRSLLDAWSWAAGAIGEYYPLLLVGLGKSEQERLATLLAEYRLTGTARPVPPLSLVALSELYRGCAAVFHPLEVSAWGDPVRLALASARPVVGLETERAAALCGPAAYLTLPGETRLEQPRRLGAALLTVIVEDSLAEALSGRARERAAAWSFEAFQQALQDFYLSIAQQAPGKDRHGDAG